MTQCTAGEFATSNPSCDGEGVPEYFTGNTGRGRYRAVAFAVADVMRYLEDKLTVIVFANLNRSATQCIFQRAVTRMFNRRREQGLHGY